MAHQKTSERSLGPLLAGGESVEFAKVPSESEPEKGVPEQTRIQRRRLDQGDIVLLIGGLLFVVFSVALPGFFSADNLFSLLRNVSILGILSLAMGVVVIGRGIDLAIVATMAMSVAWVLVLAKQGISLPVALMLGLAMAVVIGLIEGILIAYAEISALFTTLAMTSVVYGFGRLALVDSDSNYVPDGAQAIRYLGTGSIMGVPLPVIMLGGLSVVVFGFLRYTRIGRFIFAMGDNPAAARIAGIRIRPLTVTLYVISSVVAFVAGLISAGIVGEMHTRLINSTMVYDVILVVVLGGIGLSGGKGGVRNVVVGTLLIGTLLNGMTIMDFSYTTQNLVKGVVLLLAFILDSVINPRDEQTARQGDI